MCDYLKMYRRMQEIQRGADLQKWTHDDGHATRELQNLAVTRHADKQISAAADSKNWEQCLHCSCGGRPFPFGKRTLRAGSGDCGGSAGDATTMASRG